MSYDHLLFGPGQYLYVCVHYIKCHHSYLHYITEGGLAGYLVTFSSFAVHAVLSQPVPQLSVTY